MTEREANCYGTALFSYCLTIGFLLLALGCGGCADKGDPPNCSSTTSCTDVDAGSNVDADDATPDANTPDGNPADACADYAGVPSDGWQCSNGGPNFDINNLVMVVEDGVCLLHSQQIWCANNDTPPASDVLAGQFTCTDINGGSITCWHNNL